MTDGTKVRLRMPSVLCSGRLVIVPVDGSNGDEVMIGLGPGHVTYLKRDKRETYDDFVRRVTKYCEDYAQRCWAGR